jgi:hypothetical protein
LADPGISTPEALFSPLSASLAQFQPRIAGQIEANPVRVADDWPVFAPHMSNSIAAFVSKR